LLLTYQPASSVSRLSLQVSCRQLCSIFCLPVNILFSHSTKKSDIPSYFNH